MSLLDINTILLEEDYSHDLLLLHLKEASEIIDTGECLLCLGLGNIRPDNCGPLICYGMFQGVTPLGHIPRGGPSDPTIYTKLLPNMEWTKDTMAANP
nr:kallikrein 1-related peptidase b21-like [Loxodonta africana]